MTVDFFRLGAYKEVRLLRFVGIGWDVGGWLGKNNGVAAAAWEDEKITWLYTPYSTRLPKSGSFTPTDFLGQTTVVESDRIVFGVDAPLGYPVCYQELVGGGLPSLKKPNAEIDNVLAYRETERHIYKVFKKKALSASFDKLGNNASLAIATTRKWCADHGYIIHPMSYQHADNRVIIEVYPALTKIKAMSGAYAKFRELIPEQLNEKSDAFDAALCALMAIAYMLNGESRLLPEIVGPEDFNVVADEGWIYYPRP